MARQLEFMSVPYSYDGELLLAEINDAITPYTCSVQVSADGSEAKVDLADAVPDSIDPTVGELVSLHARRQLKEYRDEAFEAIRTVTRTRENHRKLLLLMAKYRRSGQYTSSYTDRIMELMATMLKDIIRRLEDGL